jgi:outer membrane protein TolC
MNPFLIKASRLRRALAAAGILLVQQPAAAIDNTALTLDEAVRLASAQSAQVIALQAQARAARETAVAAGQRPDPVLKLGVNNLPVDGAERFNIGRDFMTMRSLGVMQEFTRTEKRTARNARAQREADIAVVAQRQVTAALQRECAAAWLERSYQHSLRDLLVAAAQEAELQVQAAEALYRGGRGLQADIFAARSEAELLRDRIDQAQRAITLATTQLRRWIGDAAMRPLAARPALTIPAWLNEGFAQHLERHPQIASAAALEALARADVAIARANKSTDWSVELMYSQRGSGFSNMVSINLAVPLQWDQKRRQDRELAAAQAMAERAAAQRQDQQREHEAEVRAMAQEWESYALRLKRYDSTLLTLAQQRTAAAIAAYRASTGTLAAVLAARRAQLDTELERLRIEMDMARLWTQLHYLIPQGENAASGGASRNAP